MSQCESGSMSSKPKVFANKACACRSKLSSYAPDACRSTTLGAAISVWQLISVSDESALVSCRSLAPALSGEPAERQLGAGLLYLLCTVSPSPLFPSNGSSRRPRVAVLCDNRLIIDFAAGGRVGVFSQRAQLRKVLVSACLPACLSAMETRFRILSVYKHMLRLATGTSNTLYRQQIREAFRDRRRVTDPALVESFLQEATSKIGFLKMVSNARRPPAVDVTQSGRTTYRMVDGVLREVSADGDLGSGVRAFQIHEPGSVNPQSLARHRALMDRFRFKGPTWAGK